MRRVGRWTRLKAGAEVTYEDWHRRISSDLRALISQAGIRNYTIYRHERDLFSYFEIDDWEAAGTFLADQGLAQQWQALMAPLMDAADPLAPWIVLDEVFRLD